MTNATITLDTIDRADLPLLRRWRNDYRIWAWTRQSDLLNESEHEAWFDAQARDRSIRMYKIRATTADASQVVGVCGLTSIDWRIGRAEFSLYLAPDLHGKGLGKTCLALLLTHGFENLGLNLIWGETFDGNPAARMFEKIGMTKEGTRREFYLKDGRLIDAHLYSITAREWHDLRSRDVADGGDHPDSGPARAAATAAAADLPAGEGGDPKAPGASGKRTRGASGRWDQAAGRRQQRRGALA